MMVMAANSLISPRTSRRINELLDAALIRPGNQRLVFGVSSHISEAHSIGRSDSGWTAVSAAINHVAAAGAEPIGIAVALVMAAEVDTARRDEVLTDAAEAARTADAPLAIQDAELVPARELDAIHITAFAIGPATAAIGKIPDRELETLPMPRPPASSDTTSAANVTA